MEFKAFKQTSAKVSVLQSYCKLWTTLKAFHGLQSHSVVLYAQYECQTAAVLLTGPFIAQVKVLAFHPVQPWLAYADVNQGLTVWDWSSQQVNHTL